jgi:hypothetical protein
MSYHSDSSEKEKMEQPPRSDLHTHTHVAAQDEVDIAAKLTVSAVGDAPLSPEAATRLRYE